jgi:putative flippase GtrA
VSVVRGLYIRFQQLVHELAKFGVIGAVGFLVTTVGANILHFEVGLGPLTSIVISTIVATCLTYAGNRYWTFRHREGSTVPREFVVFVVLNGIGLLIQVAFNGFTYYVLGYQGRLAYNIALILGIGTATLFRFWSYRKFVWAAPPAASAGPAESQPLPDGPAPAAQPPVPQPVPDRGGDGQIY